MPFRKGIIPTTTVALALTAGCALPSGGAAAGEGSETVRLAQSSQTVTRQSGNSTATIRQRGGASNSATIRQNGRTTRSTTGSASGCAPDMAGTDIDAVTDAAREMDDCLSGRDRSSTRGRGSASSTESSTARAERPSADFDVGTRGGHTSLFQRFLDSWR